MKTIASLAVLSLLATAPVLAGTDPVAKVVTFNATVRVDVDAAGKPVKIEAQQNLPLEIREYLEKRVATWQYQPAKADGVAVPATTYVQVAACAIPTPAGNGFTLAADFQGNGPRTRGGELLQPPEYPTQARRRRLDAEFVLVLDIGVDGKVSINRIEKAEISRGAGSLEFEFELRRWAKTLRFDPERFAGNAVAGKIRIPVDFSMERPTYKALMDELQVKAIASRECQMAQGGDPMRPVALDSVVKVIAQPAG